MGGKNKMPLIESFTIDHRTMKAPQVRKAKVVVGPIGDQVTIFDLRFMKPNKEEMLMAGVHTLEHLLATYMREKMDNIIDLSPMGCRTGFYMTCFGDQDAKEVEEILLYGLAKVIETTEIPGATEEECGNYKDHSLDEAKKIAKHVIDGFKVV